MITTRILFRLLAGKRHILKRMLFVGLLATIFVYRMKASLNYVEEKDSFGEGISQSTKESASKQACRFPKLLVDDPLIRQHFKEESPLQCNQEKNWVYVDKGRFFIDNSAVQKHGSIDCGLWYINRINDIHYSEAYVESMKNNTAITGNMFRVKCEGADHAMYINLHAAVPIPKKPRTKRETNTQKNREKTPVHKNISTPANKEVEPEEGPKLNVMMYLLDSVSRMHFMRKLPKFYKFLTEEMHGYLLEGFNTVGDSTTAALIPLTTGMFQIELPEARKKHENATYMDQWPFIFKEYKEQGYVTTYVEEQAWTNAFHMRFKGFKEPPVDHYLRSMLIAYEFNKAKQRKYCLGDTPISITWLEFFRQLQVTHRPLDIPHFSILFTSEMSHDFYNLVQALDEHLVERFSSLLRDGYFDDTLVFVMSDHGHRHVITRKTQSGKWEERLPFLMVVPPPRFCRTYPKSCENLRANRPRLVTAFDLHATLQHILDFEKPGEDGGTGDLSDRGISIFKKIPAERTCAHAEISAHFCSCLEWTKINNPANDENVRGGAQFVVDKFNEQINKKDIMRACANLTVDRIESANRYQPNENLLSWKESKDSDNLLPDFSDNATAAAVIYQIHFVTQPGAAEWEVSVTYFVELNRYFMPPDSISRVNKYGEQARCVINDYPHLRTFCYCLRDKV